MRLPHVLSVLSVLAVVSGAVPAAAGTRATLPGPIPAEVVEVVDGDTLAVRAIVWLGQAVDIHVRLAGVDTPERRARCGQERDLAEQATRLTRRLVADGEVRLFDVTADKYGGRVRARVETADGADLARALLASGLARPYGGGRREGWCEAAAP